MINDKLYKDKTIYNPIMNMDEGDFKGEFIPDNPETWKEKEEYN